MPSTSLFFFANDEGKSNSEKTSNFVTPRKQSKAASTKQTKRRREAASAASDTRKAVPDNVDTRKALAREKAKVATDSADILSDLLAKKILTEKQTKKEKHGKL